MIKIRQMCIVNASPISVSATLITFWLAGTCYNLFKPFHIDDAAHLAIAHWIGMHPLHPMSGIIYWDGIAEPISTTNQPALYFYLLALWGSLFGYSEAAMHVLQSFFLLAVVLLFYRIAHRLVPSNAMLLTAIFTLGPSVVVGQNLMLDIPLLSIWLVFFDMILIHDDQHSDNGRRFIAASSACAAGLLIKYSSLMLLPILIAVIGQRRQWRQLWVVSIPVGTLAAWCLFNYFDYGGIHIAQRTASDGNGLLTVGQRATAWIITLGAIMPVGPILAVRSVPMLRSRAPAVYGIVTATFCLLMAAVVFDWLGDIGSDRVLRAMFLANASAFGLTVLSCLPRRPATWLSPPPGQESMLVLLLWIGGHFAFYCLFAPFMAVRHLMLVLPAFLLIGALQWPRHLPRGDALFGLAATISLTVGLGWADWRFAAFLRDEVQTIQTTLPQNSHIWFAGHWGWQWYAMQAGFLPVDSRHLAFQAGDFFVEPRNVAHRSIVGLPPLSLYRTDSKPLGFGDLFCTAGDARFYATFFVQGPWQLTRSCTNVVDIYRVE